MSYQYSTISYAGLALDTYLTHDQQTWLTLSSLASGIGVHRQTVKDWLRHHSKPDTPAIDVKVGKFKKAAKAYHVEIAVDFLKYLAAKGNKEADALLTASVVTDIQRSIKEANGIQVTAAQQEEVRTNKRLEYLQQWVKENYRPVVNKDGLVVPFEGSVAREAGIIDPYEATIVDMEAHVARREVQIARGTWNEAQVAEERKGIEKYKQNILTLAQKLTN